MDDTQDTLPQKRDFHAWYNELLWRASVMDVRYPVKGSMSGTPTALRSVAWSMSGSGR